MVHLKWVHSLVCEFYLNKAVHKKSLGVELGYTSGCLQVPKNPGFLIQGQYAMLSLVWSQ